MLSDICGSVIVAIENAKQIANIMIDASCHVHGRARMYAIRVCQVAASSFRLASSRISIAMPEKNSTEPSIVSINSNGVGSVISGIF